MPDRAAGSVRHGVVRGDSEAAAVGWGETVAHRPRWDGEFERLVSPGALPLGFHGKPYLMLEGKHAIGEALTLGKRIVIELLAPQLHHGIYRAGRGIRANPKGHLAPVRLV